MKKNVLSLLLALALSLSFAVPAAAAQFTDVKPGDYFAEAVAWAVENDITKGTSDTTFSPNDTCTRAQIITFLHRATGSLEPIGMYTVSDISPNDYFYEAVLWAKEWNMFKDNAFHPNDPCTRLMAVEFMWKFAECPTGAAQAGFTDVTSDAVDWAVENGVTKGTSDTTFSPDQTCTRGQIVTFLYRAFGETSETEPGDDPAENPSDTVGRTAVTDKAEMPGTYVREDGKFSISVELSKTGIDFEARKISNDEPVGFGSLVVFEPVAKWNGLEMDFYQECLILKTSGEAYNHYFYLDGVYIKQ